MKKIGVVVSISMILLQPFNAYASDEAQDKTVLENGSVADPRIDQLKIYINSLGIKTYQASKDKRDFNKATCIAKHLLGLKSNRDTLTSNDIDLLLSLTKESPLPKKSKPGLNVNITCQMGYFVSESKVIKIFEVTTGSNDSTPRGTYKAQRKTPTWRKSSIFDVQLYKPININGAIALHGVPSPNMIKYSPSSHGCIRIPNSTMDWLYDRIPLEAKVNIFGKW